MARGGRGGGGFSSGVGMGCGIAVGCTIAIVLGFVFLGGSCMALLSGGGSAVDVDSPDDEDGGDAEDVSPAAPTPRSPSDPSDPPDTAAPDAPDAPKAEPGETGAGPPAEPEGRRARIILKRGATLTGRIVAETDRTITLKSGRSRLKLQRGEILKIEELGEE